MHAFDWTQKLHKCTERDWQFIVSGFSAVAVLPCEVNPVLHREFLCHACWQRIGLAPAQYAQELQSRSMCRHTALSVVMLTAMYHEHAGPRMAVTSDCTE